jgi:hypothetical protein
MRQLLKPFFTERIYFFLPSKPILFRGRFYIFRRAGTFVLNLIFIFAELFIYFSKSNNSKKENVVLSRVLNWTYGSMIKLQ